MRIYSNKFENVILWDDSIPVGKTLDIDETDNNIQKLWDRYLSEELVDVDLDDGQIVDYCKQKSWEHLWDEPNSDLDECYVWIDK